MASTGPKPVQTSGFKTFKEFYPFYRHEHRARGTRVLHFIGTSCSLATLATAAVQRQPKLLPLALVCGYGFAWVGHFFVEHNKPATFKYPVWSFMADFVMYFNLLTGREPWGPLS